MQKLHCPDNIKVHFAGAEVQNHFEAAKIMGVSYYLYTCFPWVSKMVFGKGLGSSDDCKRIPAYIAANSIHTIQDSGLFTLLFGALKGKVEKPIVYKWYDALVEYTLNHGQPVTCVEVDCQRFLGVDAAWEFRERMRRDLPRNRIINVFHLEDGQKGLDRLIEFSDYIAVSVPELRFAHKRDYAARVAGYIKNKKPSIDIHMLGCTEMPIARECRFATSCDSTSYTYGVRYGRTWYLKDKKHISAFNSEKIREAFGPAYDEILKYNKPLNANALIVEIDYLKKQYEKVLGNQDYFKATGGPSFAAIHGPAGNVQL